MTNLLVNISKVPAIVHLLTITHFNSSDHEAIQTRLTWKT